MWTLFISATVAWGAAAFGAVYPWAYTPLLIAAAALGMAAVLTGRGTVPWSIALALAAVAVVIALQLVPLPTETVAAISPNALLIHKQRNLLAATGALSGYTLSIEPRQTQVALVFVVALSLLLVGGARLLTRRTARQIAVAVAIIGVTLAVIALVGRVTFNGKIYGFWTTDQPAAPFGPFVNRNHFAGWMLMALPLTIGLFAAIVSRGMGHAPSSLRNRVIWLATPGASQAILAAFAVLIMAVALVATLSRSGLVAMAGAMSLAGIMMARRGSSRGHRLLIPAYLVGVAVFAILWVGAGRLATRFEAPALIDAQGRRAIWADTIRMTQDFWLTGTGLNTFGVASLYYQTSFAGAHVREAHNDFLQLAAEGGVLGGIPLVIAVAALVTRIRKRLQSDEGSIWWIRAGATTGLLAIAAQSLVDFSLQIPGNALLFSMMCAIAVHDGGRRVRREGETDQPSMTDRLDPAAPSHQPGDDRVVTFASTNRELTFAFDDDAPDSTATVRPSDLELTDLDRTPLAIKQPSTLPFRSASYHPLRRGHSGQRRTLALVAAIVLVLFVLVLLAFAGAVQR